jgi:3-methyladenine DNA glycosylase AlkD
MTFKDIQSDVKKASDPVKGQFLQRFFKTKEGQYGHGDVFAGLTVPASRAIAKKHAQLPLEEVQKLLSSKIHEERLIALLILVDQFKKGSEKVRKEIFEFYLSNTNNINNWDLVDLSAAQIVGEYLYDNNNFGILINLAHSDKLWERRIAIIATYAFIKNGNPQLTFKISELLLTDKHDLIHKAVGWMLREVGKRCSQQIEEAFLKQHYKTMPRTMLRYAIEHFEEKKRKAYLAGTI